MTDKRISDFPAATQWHPDAFIPQDNPAGLTEKVTPAQVETKLEADGFVKAASPSLGQVAAYTAGGWAPIKLADANIDAAAAIGWGKISKSGAVASDIGAEPALGNPGVGNWWLSTFSGIRMWVATIPWGEVSKSGAVASDVGAEPALGNPGSGTWFLKTISGVRSWVAQISWASVDKTGAVASDVGALPIANPTATGTLTAPDVVVSNLAGTGTRAVAADSTGKLVIPEELNIGDNASTSALTLHCGAANGARVQFANGTGVGTVSRWASWYQSASGKFLIEAFNADGGGQPAPALEIDNASSGVAAFARSVTTNSGIGVFGSSAPGSQPVVTGSKGGNAALASLITALASYGLIVDSTT